MNEIKVIKYWKLRSQMERWLNTKKNIENLKKKYPPEQYKVMYNMPTRELTVQKR